MTPSFRSDKGTSAGHKKVPLGVNFTHYDNTQTAQHGRRIPDRGLWSPQLFAAIVRNRWHPLRRINAQGNFRPLWGRRARALASFCPARAGLQTVVVGEAFSHRLRCTWVVFWGAGAVVFVDGLACACGVWGVVWVSDVD